MNMPLQLFTTNFFTSILVFLTLTNDVFACSAFVTGDAESPIVGKSFDWHHGNGFVIVNAKNVAKRALPLKPDDEPAQWKSKYGSVSFNNIGPEFPFGGMNEKGVTVEILWRDGTKYPAQDDRPTINESQWIQYQLDTAGSVGEVIEQSKNIRISPAGAEVHYFVCDATKACAVIEFKDGQALTYEKTNLKGSLKARMLGNGWSADEQTYLGNYKAFGGTKELEAGPSDTLLMGLAAEKYSATENPDSTAYAFRVLDKLQAGKWTKWQLVYDLKNKKVHFRSPDHKTIKTVSFEKLNFSCAHSGSQNPVGLNLMIDKSGDVTSLLAPITDQIFKTNAEKNADYLNPLVSEAVGMYPKVFTRCIDASAAVQPESETCNRVDPNQEKMIELLSNIKEVFLNL